MRTILRWVEIERSSDKMIQPSSSGGAALQSPALQVYPAAAAAPSVALGCLLMGIAGDYRRR